MRFVKRETDLDYYLKLKNNFHFVFNIVLTISNIKSKKPTVSYNIRTVLEEIEIKSIKYDLKELEEKPSLKVVKKDDSITLIGHFYITGTFHDDGWDIILE